MSRFLREKRLLTFAIARVADERYAALLTSGPVLQMSLTNLRNRPLSKSHVKSMAKTIPGLYHSLVTGSKEFPVIECNGVFLSSLTATPFPTSEQSQMENTRPSPLLFAPAGLMVPKAGSRSSGPNILMPVHPEKAELGALRAERRNCVRDMEFDGSSVTRVIATVYGTDLTELNNCWRVSDYSADGHVVMSVLCQFTKKCTQTPTERKRKETEEEEGSSSSSSQSPPKKRLRL